VRLVTIRELARNPRRALGVLRYGRLPAPRYVNLRRAVRDLHPRLIVEVGTHHGAAALLMLRVARRYRRDVEYWGFDLFEEATPGVLQQEAAGPTPPPTLEEARRRLEPLGARIHLIRGDTTVTIPQTPVPPADLIFIDGGHSYETVKTDWKNVLRFTHRGTVTYFDDYTNEYGARHGYGIKRLVDGLDRSRWEVALLKPIDRYRQPDGVLETQLARVRARGSRSSEAPGR
jgi:predicted O-methyltransferase YrrM